MAGHIGPVLHMASHVHVPLKQTPCEEQPLGQGVWPAAAPRRAKADSRQLERAGLAGRQAAIAVEAEERAIGGRWTERRKAADIRKNTSLVRRSGDCEEVSLSII